MLLVVLLPMGQQLGGFLRERHLPTLMIVVMAVIGATVIPVMIVVALMTIMIMIVIMFLMVTHGIALSIQ